MAKRLIYTDSGKWTFTLRRLGEGPISIKPSLYRHWANFKERFDLMRLNQNPCRLSVPYGEPVETESLLSSMSVLKTIKSFVRGVRIIHRICSGIIGSVTHSWVLRRLLDLKNSRNGVLVGSILRNGASAGSILSTGSDIGTVLTETG